MENIKDEIKTPHLDEFNKKYICYDTWLGGTIIGLIGGIPFTMFVIWILFNPHIYKVMTNLYGSSLFFFLFGVTIIQSESLIGVYLGLTRISFYHIYGYFLRKNQLAYQEYLNYYEQEQYKEVS